MKKIDRVFELEMSLQTLQILTRFSIKKLIT